MAHTRTVFFNPNFGTQNDKYGPLLVTTHNGHLGHIQVSISHTTHTRKGRIPKLINVILYGSLSIKSRPETKRDGMQATFGNRSKHFGIIGVCEGLPLPLFFVWFMVEPRNEFVSYVLVSLRLDLRSAPTVPLDTSPYKDPLLHSLFSGLEVAQDIRQ